MPASDRSIIVPTQPSPSALRVRRFILRALLIVAIVTIAMLSGLGGRVLRWSDSVRSHSSPSQLGYIGHAGKSAGQHVIMTVEPAHPGPKFALGAVGLSIEAQELVTPDLSANHKSLVTLMRQLGPGVLRIGGDSLDYSWWTSQDEQPPEWATSKAYSASVVRPADLTRLHGLLAATGWQVILGVDLGHFDPARAANETSFAEHILGSSLLGFEIGNEPNDYGGQFDMLRPSSYGVANYLEELSTYSVAMRAAAPKIRLYGPDLGAQALQTWLPVIAANDGTSFAAITQHYYPTTYNGSESKCKPTPIPTALELLSPQVRERENAVLQAIVTAGQIAHRETRITETNTTGSCQSSDGPATSPVFASALWALDWALRSASAGIAGLNFHGYFGICAPDGFNPICAPNYAADIRGHVIARPEYYGLLAARRLEGGHFIPVHIKGQSVEDDLTAYATKHPDGAITIAISNLGIGISPSILLNVPGYNRATDERLMAPSVGATSGVTFGHASADAGGMIRSRGAAIPSSHGKFRLTLTPTSAVIVTLRR
jgi:hypothetical protein